VAGLYELKGKRGKGKVDEVVKLTGLTPEIHKKIGALSKGYRQRVGLAQSLIHDPEILILDEPTSGLDPNQLVEIRALISRVGQHKTVLLSTHILQEVEAICDRVIVIDHGKIMADGLAEQLKTTGAGFAQTIQIETSEPAEPVLWKKLEFVKNIRVIKSTQFLLETDEQRDIRGEVFNFAVSQGLTILSLSLQKKSLETVFREITSQ
jgi:ABC-2 type transport system ATP-binding protein